MLYLFCNEKYGLPFLQVAKEYAANKHVPLKVVFSGKGHFQATPGGGLPRQCLNLVRKHFLEVKLQKQYGVSVRVIKDVNAPSFCRQISPKTHGVISGFNQIFQNSTISRFESFVNFHPSVLPLYRGPAPSYWCLRNGESQTGYTLHRVTELIDDGEILFQEEISIPFASNPDQIDQILAARASVLLETYLDHLYNCKPWTVVRLDASRVYRCHVSYVSFPDAR